MILPTVHLSGTPATRLLAAALAARDAIAKAIEALNETAPHGRDFPERSHSFMGFPCAHPEPCPFHPRAVHTGALDFASAKNEHAARVQWLNDLREEMSALANHVTAAIDAATAQREPVLTPGAWPESGPGGSAVTHDERDQT